jgi:hypothetical protein
LSRHLVAGEEFWEVSVLDIPYAGKNHDAWAVGERAAAVVDGATPLKPDWPQDLKEFSSAIARHMVASDLAEPMEEVWRHSIEALRERFRPAGHRRSAGVAFVRSVDTHLEFATIGDVMALVGTSSGTKRVLDPALVALDRAAEQAGTETALLDNRAKANQPDGYAVFADDPSASLNLTTLRVAAAEVKSFALLTDGAWRHLEDDPDAALAALCATDLESALASATAVGGLSDDTTIVRFVRA